MKRESGRVIEARMRREEEERIIRENSKTDLDRRIEKGMNFLGNRLLGSFFGAGTGMLITIALGAAMPIPIVGPVILGVTGIVGLIGPHNLVKGAKALMNKITSFRQKKTVVRDNKHQQLNSSIAKELQKEEEVALDNKHQQLNLSTSKKSQDIPNTQPLTSSVSPVNDSCTQFNITDLIRAEILEKQRNVLRNYIIKYAPDKLDAFNNDEKFQVFLKNSANSDLVKKAMQEAKAELKDIEISGYQNIHEKCKDQLQSLKWDSSGNVGENVKETVIRNNNGEKICTLAETTHKINEFITKENGEEVKLESYRTIDFPAKMDAKETMHFSMVVLDEDGNRPPKSMASYFTAHYEAGEIKEISHPIPIKFNGTDDNSIGYIEHGDKVYSLPITQGKYKEMVQAVTKNKGHHVDFSKVQERISDEVSISKVQNIAKKIQHGLDKSSHNTNNTSTPSIHSKGRSKSSSLSY